MILSGKIIIKNKVKNNSFMQWSRLGVCVTGIERRFICHTNNIQMP